MIRNFLFLLKWEFKQFLSDTTLLSVFILGPLVYALLFGFVYREGKVTDLPVLVVDKDNTPLSNQLIEMLRDNEGLRVIQLSPNQTDLQKEIIRQDATSLVLIPDRFEADILQKRYPEIVTYVNTANLLTANFASKSIQVTFGTMSAGISMKALQRAGMPASVAATQYEPFKANFIRLYNETGNYLLFMWPALLAVVLQQVILLAMAVSFSREFEKKTFASQFLTRTRSGFSSILIKVLPIWIFSIMHLAIFYGLHYMFQAPIPQHVLNYVLISALFVASASFLGVFVSVLIPDALKATQILMLISSPAFIIGGFTWPLESMPAAVQFLASIIPLTPFLQAFKILLIQGGTLADTTPFLNHLLILTLIYGAMGYMAVKGKIWMILRRERRALVPQQVTVDKNNIDNSGIVDKGNSEE